MTKLYIAADYVASLIQFIKNQGVSIDGLLKAESMPSVLTGLVTFPVMSDAVSYLCAKKTDPCLGLAFGLTLDITQHGLLGYAAKSANNVLDAILLDEKYLATRTNLISFCLLTHVEGLSLHIEAVKLADPQVTRFLYLMILGSLARMYHDLSNKMLEAVFVVPFDIKFLQQYKHPLLAKITWQQEALAFRMDAPLHIAHTLILSRDATLKKLLEGQCQAALPQTNEVENLVEMVRHLLCQQLVEPPNVAQLAQQLNLSERSLKRHLQQAGTSYSAILIDVRVESAIQYLQQSSLSVSDISYRLGYASPSTFKNKFKQWTGKTPKQVRLAKTSPS